MELAPQGIHLPKITRGTGDDPWGEDEFDESIHVRLSDEGLDWVPCFGCDAILEWGQTLCPDCGGSFTVSLWERRWHETVGQVEREEVTACCARHINNCIHDDPVLWLDNLYEMQIANAYRYVVNQDVRGVDCYGCSRREDPTCPAITAAAARWSMADEEQKESFAKVEINPCSLYEDIWDE